MKLRKQTERDLQIAVMDYLGFFYPKALAIHVPNEGKRNPKYVKRSGIKSGIPDVLILEKRGRFVSFGLELKVGSNDITKNQMAFHRQLEERGWLCHVSWDFDNAKEFIDKYMSLKTV